MALSCQSIYPIQGETSPVIVSLFSRFRFVISMYCESTIFLPCKCVTRETKECFVSKTNALLVGTFISIDDVSESITVRRGLFNQGTSSYAKVLRKKKVLKHRQDCWNSNMAATSLFWNWPIWRTWRHERSVNRCVFLNLLCLGLSKALVGLGVSNSSKMIQSIYFVRDHLPNFPALFTEWMHIYKEV